MPNWCENLLRVDGSTEDLDRFREAVKVQGDDLRHQTDLSLNNIRPMPEELRTTTSPNRTNAEEMKQKYGAPDWYDWAVQNWGTKWDVDAQDISEGRWGDGLAYSFDSAWSPPEVAIRYASMRWPTLRFCLSYDEGGADFGGYIAFQAGEEIAQAHGGSRSSTWHDAADWELENLDILGETPIAEDLPTEA